MAILTIPSLWHSVYIKLIVVCIAGIKVTFDLNKNGTERVSSVAVRCAECNVPQYEPLDLEKWYRVAINSFLVTGGDGYTVIADNARNLVTGISCLAKHEAQAQKFLKPVKVRWEWDTMLSHCCGQFCCRNLECSVLMLSCFARSKPAFFLGFLPNHFYIIHKKLSKRI